jgi:hypothetical protein
MFIYTGSYTHVRIIRHTSLFLALATDRILWSDVQAGNTARKRAPVLVNTCTCVPVQAWSSYWL